MKLNLGCGDHYVPGWVNVDSAQNDKVRPDIIHDVTTGLPFADRSAEVVYMGHLLEHLPVEHVVPMLTEVARVTAGPVCVVGPDVALTWQHKRNMMEVVVNGADRWGGDRHLWGCTGEAVLFAARLAGLDATLVSVRDVDRSWPVVDRGLWQFAVTA